jgi:anti-anti-sigma factor
LSELAQLWVERDDDIVLASLSGEIDLSNADALEAELVGAAPDAARAVVLDLGATSYLDSAGVRLVFRLARRLHECGQTLHLVAPVDAPVRRVVVLTHMQEVATLDATAEEALASARAALDAS